MADTNATVPDINTALILPNGQIHPVWFQFFLRLLVRTDPNTNPDIERLTILINALYGQSNAQVDYLSSLSAIRDMAVIAQSAIYARPRIPMVSTGEIPAHGLQYDEQLHALATASLAGFMSAADKTKLNALRATIAPVTLTADVVNVNSSADQQILSTVIPANALATGSMLRARIWANISTLAAGGTLAFWIKSGATKVVNLVATLPAGALSNIGTRVDFSVTQRAGTAAVGFGELTTTGNSLIPAPFISANLFTLDPTISNTVSIGWTWFTASPSNNGTAFIAIISQEN